MTIADGPLHELRLCDRARPGDQRHVAFSLVAEEGLSFPAAMGLVVIEGIAVTILVLTGMRETIMDAIPLDLKKAIAIGIGLFIAFIGLVNCGLHRAGHAASSTSRRSRRGRSSSRSSVSYSPRAARAWRPRRPADRDRPDHRPRHDHQRGARAKTPASPPARAVPDDVYERPDLALLGNFNFDAFTELAFISALVWAFSLFLADFFDTMGTLVGVGKPAGYLDEEGRLPEIRKPLLVDSLAAVAGGAASTSSATTYIESASGVSVGGRTGWVAVVCGALFLPFMFFAPIIGMVPPAGDGPGADHRRLPDDDGADRG